MSEWAGEREWVRRLAARLHQELPTLDETRLDIVDGRKLLYTNEVEGYSIEGQSRGRSSSYETDLLIADVVADGAWTPRVVVECKLGRVTTHDALSYSAKAFTHKHVHPYLRYGFLAGALANIPGRLIKHGASFDFMATWLLEEPPAAQWVTFVHILKEEIRASRTLQRILSNSRHVRQAGVHLLQRRLVLIGAHSMLDTLGEECSSDRR